MTTAGGHAAPPLQDLVDALGTAADWCPDHPSGATRSEQAAALRARFARAASELEAVLAGLDAGALRRGLDARAPALEDLAESRNLVGHQLLDLADEIDDERIDQLGDGYVRAAARWASLASQPEPALVDEVLALERSCAVWMRKAAELPTRYAF